MELELLPRYLPLVSERPPMSHDLLAFLQQQELTARFSQEELEELVALAELRHYSKGEIILREGEASGAIYFLLRGTAEVLQEVAPLGELDDEPSGEHMLSRLEAGALLEEMSFVDGQPAATTVRAVSTCEVLVVMRERLAETGGRTSELAMKLVSVAAMSLVRRLRTLSASHVEILHDKLKQVQLRHQFANFFIVTILLFGIAATVQKLISTGLPPLWQMLYSWGMLLLTFAPISWFAWQLRLPASAWGLSWRNAGRSVQEALALGLGLAVLAVVWRMLAKAPGEPLVTWGSVANYTQAEFAIFIMAYGPHSFLQELIGRGVIQGALTRFFPESKPWWPVVLTSAFFSVFHLYVSLSFALLAFAVSLLFGLLYQRQRTLVGVTVLHYLIGCASLALGFN